MLKEFHFPDVGEGIAEGEIVSWLLKEGDWVKQDQDLVEVETDKALVTLPCPYEGKILKLHAEPGSRIRVGDVLVTVEEGEVSEATETAAKKDAGTVVGRLEEAETAVTTSVVEALPAVRALAKELGVDLRGVKGTGPQGRITREDVKRLTPGKEIDIYGLVERVPLRGIRRSVARHVAEASKRIADVTIWADADITDLEKVRAKEKGVAQEKGVRLTYLPFVIKAVIPALKSYPKLNSQLDEELEEIILKKYYNIGIAVDTPDGLMVFVVKEADQKAILDLAKEIGALSEKARKRKLELSELRGSTFTITNYGVIGASYGTPIINYPEVAILGMGKIEDRPLVKEGQIVIRRILPLSLAFDHRVIDGVEAARFMNSVIEHLEDPDLMLIEGK